MHEIVFVLILYLGSGNSAMIESVRKRQRVDEKRLEDHLTPLQSRDVLSTYVIPDQCSEVQVSDGQAIFSQHMTACLQKDLSSTGHSDDCGAIKSVQLDDGTVVKVGSEMGCGGYAYVYATNRTDIVMKISVNRPLCSEKAFLSIIGDSNMAPLVFSFSKDTSISPYCHARVILMNRVGDMDWERAYSPFYTVHAPPIFVTYCRIARLLRIVKQLHLTGFVHRDIHDENVRLSSTDYRKIWLIDFGKVRLLTESGRLNDLRAVAKLAPVGDPFFDLFKSVLNRDDYKFSACEYDRWIDQFFSLAATQNHFTDCI